MSKCIECKGTGRLVYSNTGIENDCMYCNGFGVVDDAKGVVSKDTSGEQKTERSDRKLARAPVEDKLRDIDSTLELYANHITGEFGDKITKHEAAQSIKQLLTETDRNSRIAELKRLDKQFPDLWERGKAEYTEKDMWKLAHYLIDRIKELEGEKHE